MVSGAIVTFSLFFYSYDISDNVNDWGTFGSYLRGAIGAPISILALVGAVVALYQQHKSDKKAREQNIALEVVKSIERLEERIDSSLTQITIGINFPDDEINMKTDAYCVLTDVYTQEVLKKLIPKLNSDPNVIIEKIKELGLLGQEKVDYLKLFEAYTSTTGKLKFMRSLLEQHKNLVGHNIVAIYYKNAVNRLVKAGYPIELWNNIDLIDKTNN